MLPPVPLRPIVRGWSYPTYMPVTRCGVKPMNHASFQSLLVPVLPATGRPSTLAFVAVPAFTTSLSR